MKAARLVQSGWPISLAGAPYGGDRTSLQPLGLSWNELELLDGQMRNMLYVMTKAMLTQEP